MSPGGRRSGNVDTRAEIIAAARAIFSELGFNQATLRGVARRAGVDPALIHHYFADKAQLFIEAMGLPGDPRTVKQAATATGAIDGQRLVEGFLAQWETEGDGKGSASYLSVVQAVAASPEVARAVREFLDDRLRSFLPPDDGSGRADRRQAVISSLLTGLAWTRYVMGFEPMASAPRAQVAGWVGPIIDRLLVEAPPGDPPGFFGDS